MQKYAWFTRTCAALVSEGALSISTLNSGERAGDEAVEMSRLLLRPVLLRGVVKKKQNKKARVGTACVSCLTVRKETGEDTLTAGKEAQEKRIEVEKEAEVVGVVVFDLRFQRTPQSAKKVLIWGAVC